MSTRPFFRELVNATSLTACVRGRESNRGAARILGDAQGIVGEMGIELTEEVNSGGIPHNPHRFTFGRLIHTFQRAGPPRVVSGGVAGWDRRVREEWRWWAWLSPSRAGSCGAGLPATKPLTH
jgi:hypothetical protein